MLSWRLLLLIDNAILLFVLKFDSRQLDLFQIIIWNLRIRLPWRLWFRFWQSYLWEFVGDTELGQIESKSYLVARLVHELA